MAQDNKPSKTKQAELKSLTQFNQFCQKQAELGKLRKEVAECSELIVQAKALALSPLPYHKTDEREWRREIKIGAQSTLIVSYSATETGTPLPYGKDRRLLAWLQTQAKRFPERDGFVGTQYLSDFFKAFGLDGGGREYMLFKESLKRIMVLGVRVQLIVEDEGALLLNSFPIQAAFLPSTPKEAKRKILEERAGQLALFREYDHPEYGFGVKLDKGFWGYLQENPSVMPFALMKEYQNVPKKWDWAQYVFLRCGLAKDESHVPWNVIFSLMSSSDSNTRRLKGDLITHLDELKQLYPDLPAFFVRSGLVVCPWRWRDEDRALRGL